MVSLTFKKNAEKGQQKFNRIQILLRNKLRKQSFWLETYMPELFE